MHPRLCPPPAPAARNEPRRRPSSSPRCRRAGTSAKDRDAGGYPRRSGRGPVPDGGAIVLDHHRAGIERQLAEEPLHGAPREHSSRLAVHLDCQRAGVRLRLWTHGGKILNGGVPGIVGVPDAPYDSYAMRARRQDRGYVLRPHPTDGQAGSARRRHGAFEFRQPPRAPLASASRRRAVASSKSTLPLMVGPRRWRAPSSPSARMTSRARR
jgi:hypothetical protein